MQHINDTRTPKTNDASASPCYCNCQGKHASVKVGVRFIDAVEEMKQQTLGCMFSLSRLAPKCMRLVQSSGGVGYSSYDTLNPICAYLKSHKIPRE